MSETHDKWITVLGVGNVLLRDEGAGIWALRRLEARYDFPPGVRLVDGGVLGLSLTGLMMESSKVLVIDAVRGGDEPGTIYRFDFEAKPAHIQYKDSLHQIDLMEAMGSLALIGDVPQVTVIGVEYEDIVNWGMELTDRVQKAMDPMVELVVKELRDMGLVITPKENPQEVANVLGGACQSYRD